MIALSQEHGTLSNTLANLIVTTKNGGKKTPCTFADTAMSAKCFLPNFSRGGFTLPRSLHVPVTLRFVSCVCLFLIADFVPMLLTCN